MVDSSSKFEKEHPLDFDNSGNEIKPQDFLERLYKKHKAKRLFPRM